jgi:hypothetical protein
MYRLLAIILVCSLSTPAHAKEKCTSMCPFFNAWAITQVCRNLTFNDNGRQTDKDFGDLRTLKRQALAVVKRWPNACRPDCKWEAEAPDDIDEVCHYLKEVK